MAISTGTPPLQSTSFPGMFGDPVQQKVQQANDEGRLTNSQRVILDSIQSPLTSTVFSYNLGGASPGDVKALAERSKRYSAMVDKFVGHPVSHSLSSDEQIQQVGNYDRQTSERQVRETVRGIGGGKISAGEFRVLNDYGTATETLRGQLKGDGYTQKERETLEGRFTTYDTMLKKFLGEDATPAPTQKSSSDALFNQAKSEGAPGNFGGFSGSSEAERKILADRSKGYSAALLKSGGLIEPSDRQGIRQTINGPVRKLEDWKEPPVTDHAMDRLKAMFGSIDKSRDGKLTRPEMLAALSDPKWKGDDARVLAAATRVFDEISVNEAPGTAMAGTFSIGGNSESRNTLSLASLSDDKGPIKTMLSHSYADFKDLPKGPQSLYGKDSAPNLRSLQQGSEGDCWALASVTSMKPGEVQRMLEQRPDGSYMVKFPGRKPEAVAALTDGERQFYSSSNGSWSGVLEKGLRQVMEREALAKGKNLDFSDLMNGGLMGRSTEILTGQGSKDYVFAGMSAQNLSSQQGMIPMLDRPAEYAFSPKKVGGLLSDAFAQGKPVTAATSPLNDKQGSRVGGQGHAYAVIGYDEKSQTVTLRNPWGKGEKADVDGKDDGLFQMPMAEFQSSFSFMNIGGQAQKAGVK
jgi:hypothetical protein